MACIRYADFDAPEAVLPQRVLWSALWDTWYFQYHDMGLVWRFRAQGFECGRGWQIGATSSCCSQSPPKTSFLFMMYTS